ncbi:MAG: TetR/AcrR family transcriptional regulator [Xanthobacteraceae bacterium]|nr:TetR/AcrR family transcriptional regulator [Xanthobacteraceae bacterium]
MARQSIPSTRTAARTAARRAGSGARRRGRPVGDREAKRAGLLKAAIAVIAQEGLAGASLRKVAQRAGCTTGAVAYYFANKEAMVVAVAENLFDQFDAQLGRGEDRVDVGVGLQRWFDWIDSDDPTPWQAGFQLLAHARREPAFAALYRRRYARYRAALTAILARGQSRGAIRDDIAADLLADQLSAMGDGWMMLLPIEPDRFRPARVRALLDATLTMIAPPDRGR